MDAWFQNVARSTKLVLPPGTDLGRKPTLLSERLGDALRLLRPMQLFEEKSAYLVIPMLVSVTSMATVLLYLRRIEYVRVGRLLSPDLSDLEPGNDRYY